MAAPPDLLLGPLTTIFTAPPDCNSITVSEGDGTYAPYVYPRLFSSIASSCFPSGYPLGYAALTSTYSQYNYQDQHVYFSPGICPSGWPEYTVGVSNGETTAFCCEPGFYSTTSPAVIGPIPSTLCATQIDSTVITTVAYTGDGEADGGTMTFTFGGNNIPAGAIWIRYKDSDIPTAAATSASSAAASSSSLNPALPSRTQSSPGAHTSFPGSLPSGTAHNSPSTSFHPGGTQAPSSNDTSSLTTKSAPGSKFSTGAKIGIGVGIPFAVILAVTIFAFIFIRRRNRTRAFDNQIERADDGVTRTSELYAGEVEPKRWVRRSELDGSGSTIPAYELEGTDGNWQVVQIGDGTRGA